MADEKQQLDWDKIKKFSKQVSNDIGAAMLGALSYIGDRLGIFSALAQAGAVTSARLAEKTGLSERYLREWLGAMTAAGYVNYDAAAEDLRDAARACDGARARRLAVLRRRLHRNDRSADVDRAESDGLVQGRARRFAE